MISHLHLINMSRKQTANQLCFLIPLSLMPILCHCCVKLQRREWSSICILLWKRTVFASFKPTFWNPILECELNCLHFYNQDMNNIAFVEHVNEETEWCRYKHAEQRCYFWFFFSCHVINGSDYSNEHMNLKTTSQKWCIYISNEINRREREIVLIETLQTRWCSPERSRAIHED